MSPSDTARVQRMEVEESPTHDRHPSASMGNVFMEALNLGGKNNDTEHIQQIQASLVVRADDVMETEAPIAVEVTTAHTFIAEEGATVCSSVDACPPNDEVIHL